MKQEHCSKSHSIVIIPTLIDHRLQLSHAIINRSTIRWTTQNPETLQTSRLAHSNDVVCGWQHRASRAAHTTHPPAERAYAFMPVQQSGTRFARLLYMYISEAPALWRSWVAACVHMRVWHLMLHSLVNEVALEEVHGYLGSCCGGGSGGLRATLLLLPRVHECCSYSSNLLRWIVGVND